MIEGEQAPGFSLPGTEGSTDFERYSLSEFTDRGAVVLAFYPFDFSPVCVSELCAFRDAEWLMMREHIDVFGISRDSCYAHRRFIDEYDLPFPLLSDVEGDACERYGVKYDRWEGHPGVPKRTVFIVDATSTIQYRWQTEDAYENPDINELADVIADLPSVNADPDELV